MPIELEGRGYVSMHEPSWNAVRKIAREFGWMPEYERRDGENTGLGYEVAGLERRHEELLT